MPVDINIVLLNPPLTKEERGSVLSAAAARSVPYGLLSVASVLRKNGYRISFIDATNLGYGVEETVHRILSLSPGYVGISLVTITVDKAVRVAELIKEKHRDIKIIVGGPHLSSLPEETMKSFPCFDIGVIGEGEETIADLLGALEGRAALRGVRGIIYREGEEVVRTAQRPFLDNLDSLPLPAWDLVPRMADFYRPSIPSHVRLPSATIVTSRGCPGCCIFCNSRAIFGKLRCFSAGYVMKIIRHLIDTYRIRDLSIYDDNFIFFQDRVKMICDALIGGRLDLTWSCYSRVDQGNLELFRLMKKAGCWQISYGIESGSQRILDFIKKNVTLEQIKRTVTHTKESGIRTRGFFMIGHPTEDAASIRETIRFMKEIPLDDFHFTYFTPLPGTPVYAMADQYGTFDKTWSKMNMQYPVFVPAGLSAGEMENYSKAAYRSFYFRPKIIASHLAMVIKYPHNAGRLIAALNALLSRIFLRNF